MKGCLIPLLCITMCSSAFAVDTAAAASSSALPGSVSHAAQGAAAGSATTDTQTTTTANANAPSLNYLEVIGGFGAATPTVGKSSLTVTNSETDWISQAATNNWQSPFLRLGLGYVYSLSGVSRGYSPTMAWFPTIEPMLNFYYSKLNANGNVHRFNSNTPVTSTFDMPIKTASLMFDVALTLGTFKQLSVFVLGGVGTGWSRIGYSDSPKINNPLARPPLRVNTFSEANPTYEWGGGLSYAFNQRLALDLEYLYTHIGNVNTSKTGTLGSVNDTQLHSAGFSLRTQALLLNLHVALY